MTDVKWVKLYTDIFNNRKIKQIESMENADSILIIWFKILTLAGIVNDSGALMITENMPYTEEMLATQFQKPISVVHVALQIFEQFGMIDNSNGVYIISNWEKYQNIEELDRIREQTRKRVAKHREKQKVLQTSTSDIKDKHSRCEDDYNNVVDLYNTICKSLRKVNSLSNARRAAICNILNTYSVDELKNVFQKAESSDFLKGTNDRKWKASLDWILKEENIIKILDGNYDNISTNNMNVKNNNNFEHRKYDMENLEANLVRCNG